LYSFLEALVHAFNNIVHLYVNVVVMRAKGLPQAGLKPYNVQSSLPGYGYFFSE
jgi:hypothetical protein